MSIAESGKATRFKSGSKAVAAGRKGGKASGVTKAKQKTMREAMAAILSGTYDIAEGKKLTGTEIAQRLIREITGEDVTPEDKKLIDKKLELFEKQIELTEARADNMGW